MHIIIWEMLCANSLRAETFARFHKYLRIIMSIFNSYFPSIIYRKGSYTLSIFKDPAYY